ncbi:MAG: hypothetical protein ABI988_19205 [Nitrospirota bacterium]
MHDLHKGKWHRQPQSELSKAVAYLRSIGAIAFLFGAGGMIQSTYYWWAVAAVYTGLLILVIDLWIERNLTLPWKIIFSVMLLGVGIGGSILYVFPSAPLEIQMIRHRGDFKEGEIIGGIPWTSNYSELRVSFSNGSEEPYTDVDMLINNDLFVAQAGWVSNPANCSLNLKKEVLDMRLKGKDKNGKSVEQLFLPFASDYPYHMHCDKLFPHEPVQIVFAVVSGEIQNLNEADIKKPASLFGHKKLPGSAVVKGSYKTQIIRPHIVFKREQLTGD